MPTEWRGTTFKNSELLGREVFGNHLTSLMAKKMADGGDISTADLIAVGNAEDYFRVASNVSTTLELALAHSKQLPINQVFGFGSTTMPILSVVLTSGATPVHFYSGAVDAAAVFTAEQLEFLEMLGGKLVLHGGAPAAHAGEVVVAHEAAAAAEGAVAADAVVTSNVLYILNPAVVDPAKILVIRKRMATPPTTPMAEEMMQTIAKVPVTANQAMPTEAGVAAFYGHLQELAGTAVNTGSNPIVFTAGLPALCTLFMTLIKRGGADIMMCSTAYGGCSQLTDLLNERTPRLRKSTFDIQGGANINDRIKGQLDKLAADPPTLLPTTVLFVEVPTNPDMKVPDVKALTATLQAYKEATGKDVLLLVDATFAPNSKVLQKISEAAPDLPAMVFVSMSKSISRGVTTAGALVANHTAKATELIQQVSATGAMLDTTAKPDQMNFLVDNHEHVEERCQQAYDVAVAVGRALQDAVKKHRAYDMPLAFVSPENAAIGFTSSTFSFNLPSPEGATADINAGLAQRFVDELTVHSEFKPCVSFGQDNNLIYCTVPATSTQGAIKEEDKAKQAVGGVQLTRLSFPPTCDTAKVVQYVEEATAKIYSA